MPFRNTTNTNLIPVLQMGNLGRLRKQQSCDPPAVQPAITRGTALGSPSVAGNGAAPLHASHRAPLLISLLPSALRTTANRNTFQQVIF